MLIQIRSRTKLTPAGVLMGSSYGMACDQAPGAGVVAVGCRIPALGTCEAFDRITVARRADAQLERSRITVGAGPVGLAGPQPDTELGGEAVERVFHGRMRARAGLGISTTAQADDQKRGPYCLWHHGIHPTVVDGGQCPPGRTGSNCPQPVRRRNRLCNHGSWQSTRWNRRPWFSHP